MKANLVSRHNNVPAARTFRRLAVIYMYIYMFLYHKRECFVYFQARAHRGYVTPTCEHVKHTTAPPAHSHGAAAAATAASAVLLPLRRRVTCTLAFPDVRAAYIYLRAYL